MERFYLILLCIFSFSLTIKFDVIAQNIVGNKEIDTTFNTRMNYIFGHLETGRIPYGLLRDYAFEYTDLSSYNGNIMADSTLLSRASFFGIYNTLVTAQMTAAAHNNMAYPELIDSLWFRSRQPGRISIAGLFYQYARFSSDAYTSNKISSNNDQLYDVYNNGVWQNPYVVERTLGFAPSTSVYQGLNFNVHFTDSLWLSNSKTMVDHIEVDVSDGRGYLRLTPGSDLPVSYSDSGSKVWNFKIILTDQTVLQSHTLIHCSRDIYGDSNSNFSRSANSKASGGHPNGVTPLGGLRYKVISSETYNGAHATGLITLQYAQGHTSLQKPLIVIEGYDPGFFTVPETLTGAYTLVDYNQEIANSPTLQNILNNSYDIIFVDYRNGTDDIHRNALLVKEVIRWVNSNKTTTTPNVLLGLSMGGLTSRFALKTMENNNEQHQVRLFISHDSPHGGANFPLGYQFFEQHINKFYIRSGIASSVYNSMRFFIPSKADLDGLLSISEAPASKQMLLNHINSAYNLDNNVHNAWQSELTSLGYPSQCRNIAISNGSECGSEQTIISPGGQLLKIDGYYKPGIIVNSLFTIASPLISFATYQPALLLGIIPGSNQINFHFQVNAGANGGGNQVYTGNVVYHKKILFLINVNATLTSLTKYAFGGALPYDSYGGGIFDTKRAKSFASSTISINAADGFCFVPTPSSLDISGNPTNLNNADYHTAYEGDNPPSAPKQTPFSNFVTAFYNNNGNEYHITYETRNGNWLTAELNAPANSYPSYGCETFCANTTISGSASVCPSSGTTPFSVPAYSSNVTYNWTTTSNLQVASGQGTNTANIRGTGSSGTGTITLTISNSQCGTVVINRTVTIGGSQPTVTITATMTGACRSGGYQDYQLTANPSSPNGTNWRWTQNNPVSGNTITFQNPNAQTTIATVHGSVGINVVYTDACGTTSTQGSAGAYSPCRSTNSTIASYPNPANKEMNIQYQAADDPAISSDSDQAFSANAVSKTSSAKSYNVILYNDKGKILRNSKSEKGEAVKLNTADIPNGNYFLHVLEGKEITKKQVIIQH